MLAINQVLINRYKIINHLGHGGMGTVYEAIDERFGEPIALKEINIETASKDTNDSILRAFEREAKSLAKARHEAIPFVRDYFSENGKQFLVMELIEGEDLSQMLAKRQELFPVQETLGWLDQLLDALDYLHTLTPPIIHRDIKPQNLKINSRRRIKLLDFGIAKSVEAGATSVTQTFVGATLEYSPIEQLLRVIDPTFREFILLKHKTEGENVLQQTTDARSDIYSLGATFYHFLTNQPPIESTKRSLEVWTGNPDPLKNPTDLNPNISPALASFLLKAIEIERDNRFSTAAEMREALQSVIADEKNQVRVSPEIAGSNFEPKETPLWSATTVKEIQTPSTKPSVQPNFETNISADESSDKISQPTVTAIPYANKGSSDSIPTITGERESKAFEQKAKTNWLLPVAAVGILAVGGIGGAVWMNSSNAANSNTPAANAVSSTPTVQPSIEPTITATVMPSVSPSVNPTVESQAANKPSERPKPTVLPTAEKTIKQTTTKKTPTKPATPKPSQDPNCVFTNSCQ